MTQMIQTQAPKTNSIGSHPRSWLKRPDGTPIPAKHSLLDGKPKKAAEKPTAAAKASKPAPAPKAKAPKAKPAKKAPTPCLCACGTQVARSFAQGHDARLHGQCLKVLRGELRSEQVKALKNPAAVAWLRTRTWVDTKMRAALGITLKG